MFDGNSQLGCAFQHEVDVDRVGLAVEDFAAGGVTEDADVLVLESAEDSGRWTG